MSAPVRIQVSFDHEDRAYLPGEPVSVTLELKASRAFTASVTAGCYATAGDDPGGERLHLVDAELASKTAFAVGEAQAFPVAFTAPDLPAHELRKLRWWVFAALDMGMTAEEDLTEVRGFTVQHAEDRLREAQKAGKPVDSGLKVNAWQQQAGNVFWRAFLSVFTLGGGLAAMGVLFSPYWPTHAYVAGVRWFIALVVLGGLAIGRKLWEAEDPAKHGRDAAAGFFVPFFALIGGLCLYVWALEPGFHLAGMRLHPGGIHGIHQFYAAIDSPGGHLLAPLFLGVVLFSLAGFASAPRQVGVSAMFMQAATVLAGLAGASGVSAFLANTGDWGALVAFVLGTGLFVYLCRRPDWANKGLKFNLIGLIPVVLLGMFQSGAMLFAPAQTGGFLPGLAGLLALLAVLGTMGYLGNRNLLAAMQVGSIRVDLRSPVVAPGRPVEVALRIVPRRAITLEFSRLDVSCWRSQRNSGNDDTDVWRAWHSETKGETVSLVPGQTWEKTLLLTLPIDARITETGSNATWWEAHILLSFANAADWSMDYRVEVKR